MEGLMEDRLVVLSWSQLKDSEREVGDKKGKMGKRGSTASMSKRNLLKSMSKKDLAGSKKDLLAAAGSKKDLLGTGILSSLGVHLFHLSVTVCLCVCVCVYVIECRPEEVRPEPGCSCRYYCHRCSCAR